MTLDWSRRETLGGIAALSLSTGCATAQGGAKLDPALVRELAPTGRLRTAINLGNVVLAKKGGPQGATGASVDIANELGRRLGVPVDLMLHETAGTVVSSLDTSPWDLAFMAIEPARADKVQFTPPYVYIDGTYLVRVDAPYRAAAELDRTGIRIAVGKGTGYDLYLTRTLKNATLVRSQTSQTAIDQFVAERLDAAAGIRPALVDAAKALSGNRVLEDSFSRIEQAVAIPQGRPKGFAYVAAMMEELKASGFVRAALDRAGQTGAPVAPAVRL